VLCETNATFLKTRSFFNVDSFYGLKKKCKGNKGVVEQEATTNDIKTLRENSSDVLRY